MMPRRRSATGRELNRRWNVGARHPLYREDGIWYHLLTDFPGALFDAHGYVVFETEEDFRRSPYLSITKHVHVGNGISQMPSYVRVVEPN